jgi:hypothetical protein
MSFSAISSTLFKGFLSICKTELTVDVAEGFCCWGLKTSSGSR